MTPIAVASVHVHPVKSLGGFTVPQARLTDRGLEHDRRWMLVDEDGCFLSQREVPAMACLHCAPNGIGFTISDTRNGSSIDLPWVLDEGERSPTQVWDDEVEMLFAPNEMHQWFSDALERNARIAYMPDSTVRATDPHYAHARVALSDAFPCLIISQASLEELNARLETPVPMERFRPNLVISGGWPFQEDDWKEITIGTVRFTMMKPCSRCGIVNTDQRNGSRGLEPLHTLATYRSVGNKVRFGMNATFAGQGMLHVGDPVHVSA